jgi:hypothetical protein
VAGPPCATLPTTLRAMVAAGEAAPRIRLPARPPPHPPARHGRRRRSCASPVRGGRREGRRTGKLAAHQRTRPASVPESSSRTAARRRPPAPPRLHRAAASSPPHPRVGPPCAPARDAPLPCVFGRRFRHRHRVGRETPEQRKSRWEAGHPCFLAAGARAGGAASRAAAALSACLVSPTAAPQPASGRPWSREQGSAPEGGDPRRSWDLGAVGLACAGPIPPPRRRSRGEEDATGWGREREGEPGCGWGREEERMTSASRRR